eukprot:scaffold35523_cov53-Phaeocystis_antarctica.AAC.4
MSSNPPEGTGGADPNWEILADASVGFGNAAGCIGAKHARLVKGKLRATTARPAVGKWRGAATHTFDCCCSIARGSAAARATATSTTAAAWLSAAAPSAARRGARRRRCGRASQPCSVPDPRVPWSPDSTHVTQGR